ncbi:MAG TPA: NUDIX domain-containing protein [Terriglobia bacterium]|nr:NUDIX domain-containing protein [Terriglobia bacterium]
MSAVSGEMVIDAVDQNDSPTSTIRRNEVFERRVNFRVVHILVFNRRGELLLQQLSRTRTRHPGYWGSSVAGYIFAGESYEAAAGRRLGEELGIYGVSLNYIGKTSIEDDGCHKFVGVFSTIHDGPFNFDRDHIEALEFLPRHVIHELHARGTRKFTPTFLRVLSFYESRM